MAKKCDRCLRGARIDITGTDRRTLKLDMGGAVLYLIPGTEGKMSVVLNSEALIDGDYAAGDWDGENWRVATGNGQRIYQG